MYKWIFEHRILGKRQEEKIIWSDTIQDAVSRLSNTYKGVFRLVDCRGC